MVLVKYGIAALLAFGPLSAMAQDTTGGVADDIPEQIDCDDENNQEERLCGGLALLPLGAAAAGAIPLAFDASGGALAVSGILGAAASGNSTTSTTSTVSTTNPQ